MKIRYQKDIKLKETRILKRNLVFKKSGKLHFMGFLRFLAIFSAIKVKTKGMMGILTTKYNRYMG